MKLDVRSLLTASCGELQRDSERLQRAASCRCHVQLSEERRDADELYPVFSRRQLLPIASIRLDAERER
jgi:hypothetical protein